MNTITFSFLMEFIVIIPQMLRWERKCWSPQKNKWNLFNDFCTTMALDERDSVSPQQE